jgi:PAS domain S-box-containing protein
VGRLDARVREICGLPAEPAAFPIEAWLGAIAPADRGRVIAEFERAINEEDAFGLEFAVVHPDGTRRTVASSGIVARNEAGQATQIHGVAADVTEQRRTEAAVRASEERFRATFEQAAVGIAHVGRDGRLLRLNQRLADTLGHAPEALLGRPLADLITPRDRAAHLTELRRVGGGEATSSTSQIRYLRRDGTAVWVRVTASLARPAEAEPYLIAVVEDISRRKADERARARTDAAIRRQANLLDQAYDAIFAWDWDGTITYWNRGAERLYGFSADEALGKPSHDLLRTDHGASVQQILAALARDGIWEGELEHTAHDGRRITVESRHLLVREAGRRYVLEVNRDVTARRAAEREREALVGRLAAERARLRAILEQMPSGVIIGEAPSGRLILGNPQVEQIWRHPFLAAAEIGEYGAYKGFHADGRPVAPAEWPLARAITAGETVTGEEFEIERGDGSRGAVSFNAAPIRDDAGTIVAGVVTFDDVTERKRSATEQRFLAEASAELASSLDYEATLGRVARLAVPRLADLCLIDVVGDDGALRRLAVAHADPAAEVLLQQDPQRSLTPLSGSFGPPRVLRTGRAEVVPAPDDLALPAMADEAEQLAALRETGLGSSLSVPMTTRGRTIGVLTLAATAGPGRRFGAADLPLAEEIAGRAAVAVDTARLYAAEQRARQAAERASARIARLQGATRALAEALTLEEVAAAVVDQGITALGADAGSLALATPDRALEIIRAIGYPSALLEPWRRFGFDAPVPLAEAARTGNLVVLQAPTELAARYPRLARNDARPNHATLVAVPLLVEERTIGAMGLSFATPQEFTDEDHAYLIALARQAAQALERARLYAAERQAREQAEAAEGRLAFLAEASAVLAGSLDIEQTLRQVAELVVPRLADWCVVHLIAADGRLAQLAVAHTDPAMAALARDLYERYPPDLAPPPGIGRVLERGEPELHPTIDAAALAAAARDEEHLGLLRSLGPSSAMIVPIVAHGQTLGAISLVAAESGRRYGADDLAFAEDLAGRCAVAVANARLYAAERTAREASRAAEQAGPPRRRPPHDPRPLVGRLRRRRPRLRGGARRRRRLHRRADRRRLRRPPRLRDGLWADVAAVHHPRPGVAAASRAYTSSRRQPVGEGFSAEVLRTGTSADPAPARSRSTPRHPRPRGLALSPTASRSTACSSCRCGPRAASSAPSPCSATGRSPAFDDEDRAFLQELADRAALAIENARLYREAQEAVRARDEFLSIAATSCAPRSPPSRGTPRC